MSLLQPSRSYSAPNLTANVRGGSRWKLSAPVGVGQPNVRADVLMVQILLNRSRSDDPAIDPLPETGVFDHATRMRLAHFQKSYAHLRRADAVIDLPGPTERALQSLRQGPLTGRPLAIDMPMAGSSDRPVVEPDGYVARLLALKAASPKSATKKMFFNKLLPPAAHAKIRWGTPIAVLLAQAALESTWGQTAPGNAYFGIKGKSSIGKSQMLATHEERGDILTLRLTLSAPTIRSKKRSTTTGDF